MTPEKIKKTANDLVLKYAAGRFPVPVIEVATRLGIKVLSSSDYKRGGNGHIEIDPENNATIIVNENQCAARKRFTIAHEIAHFKFDKDYLASHGCIDRDGDAADATYRSREKVANAFAANLLMPEEQFIEQWLALRSNEKVADYFAVSPEAVKYRAINIGLVQA